MTKLSAPDGISRFIIASLILFLSVAPAAAAQDSPVAPPTIAQNEAELALSDKCKAAIHAGETAKENDVRLFMSIGDACSFPSQDKNNDLVHALNWYTKAAELGYADAQYMLCFLSKEHNGPSPGEVFKWCLAHAQQGDGDGFTEHAVAEGYETGDGTQQSLVQAYLWAMVAVKSYVDPAVRDYHVEYLKKLSAKLTPDQIGEAQRLFTEWRPQKKVVGKYSGVGMHLGRAQGVFYVRAVLVGSPAKLAGIKPGDNILMVDGMTVENMTLDALAEKLRGARGTTVEVTISRQGKSGMTQLQFKMMREDLSSVTRIDHNNRQPRIDANLGMMYLNGWGVKQDFAEAAKWFLEAAQGDDSEAQVKLGDLYESGKGVPQSWPEAYFWYSVASRFDLSAREKKDMAAKHLSPEEAAEVDKRAAAWQPPASDEGGTIEIIRGGTE